MGLKAGWAQERAFYQRQSVWGKTGEMPVLYVNEAHAGDLVNVDLLILGFPTHGALPTVVASSRLSATLHM